MKYMKKILFVLLMLAILAFCLVMHVAFILFVVKYF